MRITRDSPAQNAFAHGDERDADYEKRKEWKWRSHGTACKRKLVNLWVEVVR